MTPLLRRAMFTRQPKSRLQIEIDRLVLQLDAHEPTSEEFGAIVERLSKLHKMNQDVRPASVDPNTALTVAANLLGIAMIVRHENLNVITTKALSFVMKAK
jgi:hypothetical protein